jgi:AcrR family transcriptional regulator
VSGKLRPRRSDATANVGRLQAAALDLLGRGSDPSMGEIAAAAGVSRQTAYSHFHSRQALCDALVAHVVAVAAEALDADLPADPVAGLESWLDRAWSLIDEYPALLNPALYAGSSRTSDTEVMSEHEPVVGGLRRVLERAREHDLLPAGASPDWLVAAVIALGHAAGQEVTAGRMRATDAGAAFRSGALRLCLRGGTVEEGRRTSRAAS